MRLFISGLVALVLVGCGAARPTREYRTGEVLLEEPFDAPFAWESYRDPRIDADLFVDTDQGVYSARTGSGSFSWGVRPTVYRDVIIEVQATLLSADQMNLYGVMCRADTSNNGDGYYFVVSGDGYYSIRRTQNGESSPLVSFTETAAPSQGQAINTLRAVCIEDYLALYVNGEFVGETYDDTFSSGYPGLVVAAGEDRGEVEAVFDNVRVIEASLVPVPE